MNIIQELRTQGYVLINSELDMLSKQCTVQEL